MKLDDLILTKTNKKGKSNEEIGKNINFYSDVNRNQRTKKGFSIMVHIKVWEEIDERIIKLELRKSGHEIVKIGVYAPEDDSKADVKEEFF